MIRTRGVTAKPSLVPKPDAQRAASASDTGDTARLSGRRKRVYWSHFLPVFLAIVIAFLAVQAIFSLPVWRHVPLGNFAGVFIALAALVARQYATHACYQRGLSEASVRREEIRPSSTLAGSSGVAGDAVDVQPDSRVVFAALSAAFAITAVTLALAFWRLPYLHGSEPYGYAGAGLFALMGAVTGVAVRFRWGERYASADARGLTNRNRIHLSEHPFIAWEDIARCDIERTTDVWGRREYLKLYVYSRDAEDTKKPPYLTLILPTRDPRLEAQAEKLAEYVRLRLAGPVEPSGVVEVAETEIRSERVAAPEWQRVTEDDRAATSVVIGGDR